MWNTNILTTRLKSALSSFLKHLYSSWIICVPFQFLLFALALSSFSYLVIEKKIIFACKQSRLLFLPRNLSIGNMIYFRDMKCHLATGCMCEQLSFHDNFYGSIYVTYNLISLPEWYIYHHQNLFLPSSFPYP